MLPGFHLLDTGVVNEKKQTCFRGDKEGNELTNLDERKEAWDDILMSSSDATNHPQSLPDHFLPEGVTYGSQTVTCCLFG